MHEVRISLGLHEFLLEANVIRPTISAGLLHTDLAIKEQSGTLLLQQGFFLYISYISCHVGPRAEISKQNK